MFKRGLSALISTVLLIGFAVALIAVFFVWGFGYAKLTIEDASKTAEESEKYIYGVSISVRHFSSPRVMTIENNGDIPVVGLLARGESPSRIYIASSLTENPTIYIPGGIINPFEIKKIVINFDLIGTGEGWLDLGDIEIIPFIDSENGPIDVVLRKQIARLPSRGVNYCSGADYNDDGEISIPDTNFFIDNCLKPSLTSFRQGNGWIMPQGCEFFDVNNGVIDNIDAQTFAVVDWVFVDTCTNTEVTPQQCCDLYYLGINDCNLANFNDYSNPNSATGADCLDNVNSPSGVLNIEDFYWFNANCYNDFPLEPIDPLIIDPLCLACGDFNDDGSLGVLSVRYCNQPCLANTVCEPYFGESCTNCPVDCGVFCP